MTDRFGQRLKEARRSKGLSQKELADQMQVTRNTVINWERDKSRPDYRILPALCRILETDPAALLGVAKADSLSALESRVVKNLRSLSGTGRRMADRMIAAMLEEELLARDKVLKEEYALFQMEPGSAAAGDGCLIPEIPPVFVFRRRNDRNRHADAIVRVKGHSMEPVYRDGDEVYLAYSSSAWPGEDVVCATAEGAVLKRLGNDHTLYSINPDLPYHGQNEDSPVKILGRVLGIVSSSDCPRPDEIDLLEELFAQEIRNAT
ncbi:MAG: LexA family transcriptional regulator [Parasporobacterium sp.]|nr:LexA family transcriptional regulator [Parasporobacterium sp.]